MTEVLRQEAIHRAEVALDVAVLKEQMRNVISSQTEMKAASAANQAKQEAVNASQDEKLDLILTQLAKADGGWAAVMWLGGAFGALSAVVVGWMNYFMNKH